MQSSTTYDYTSMGSTNEPGGFWGVLARKAKSILDDDEAPRCFDTPNSVKPETVSTSNQVTINFHNANNSRKSENYEEDFLVSMIWYDTAILIQVEHRYESFENSRKMDNPKLRKGLDRLTSSLNQIGDSIGNALEVNILD